MRFKKTLTGALIAGAITLSTTGAFAFTNWAGHNNIEAVKQDLVLLVNLNNSKKDKINTLQAKLEQATVDYNNLANQLKQEQAELDQAKQAQLDQANTNQVALSNKQKELDTKQAELNARVDEFNKQLADKQQEIANLNNSLGALKQSSDEQMNQAVNDAQQVRNQADQAVQQATQN